MALIRIPHVTLHRNSLANMARIVKLNIVDLGGNADAVSIVAPNHRAVSNFFTEVNKALRAAITETVPLHENVRFYRNDINQALQAIRVNMWTGSGASLPGQPPIQHTPISGFATTVLVPISPQDLGAPAIWAGAPDSYTIDNMPSGLTFNTTIALLEGTPDTIANYSMTITATNANGSTESNQFVIDVVSA